MLGQDITCYFLLDKVMSGNYELVYFGSVRPV